MPRPTILGVVGDSAAGKTTLTRGLVRILGEDKVTHVCTDDYHRYDRKQRAERNITPLDPACNYVDIMAPGSRPPEGGEAILKPVYRHADGTFGAAGLRRARRPSPSSRGCSATTRRKCATSTTCGSSSPPRRTCGGSGRCDRDCSRRGYTTDQVLAELDRREPDSAAYIRPQERYADLVVSFMPGDTGDAEHLDAELVLREGLPHPDLSPFIGNGGRASRCSSAGADRHCASRATSSASGRPSSRRRSGIASISPTHLRSQRLGEFTVGTELHRSESLALVQLLILYHVVTARAAIAVGGAGTRTENSVPPDETRALGQPASASSKP